MGKILLTGGAGYIGSHTAVELIESDYDIIIFDNLSNSSYESCLRVEEITGKEVAFVRGDIRSKEDLQLLFEKYPISAVMHFAGLKSVNESIEKPLCYYENNVIGTINLLEIMQEFDCKKIIFSSSATVYGEPAQLPIKESFPVSATNPYGRSKLMVEDILRDLHYSDNRWSIALLRYFNPVGAHSSGLIGEDPQGIPNNLMPFITQTALGVRKKLQVFGDDYPTKDGTGVRDFIHVMDLARGHLAALDKIEEGELMIVNLGTGQGYSVLEMIRAFEKASSRVLPYIMTSRRAGDVAEVYADPSYAKKRLGWQAELGLKEMCEDSWRWQSNNPKGY